MANEIKIERAWLGKVLYGIHKNSDRREIYISGYDMGARIHIAKHLDDKYFIVKVPSHRTLCGARGMGMVYDDPTSYYLVRKEDDVLDPGWNYWEGRITFLLQMSCGRNWKLGLIELEKKYEEIKNGNSDR